MLEVPELLGALRPRPRLDPLTRPYWSAARAGRLLVQRCTTCGHTQHYPRARCRRCLGEPVWEQSSGTGRVHTFTVVRQNHAAPFDRLQPYVVAMVDLDDGPRLLSNLTDVAPDDVAIGLPVEVWFLVVDDDVALPMFRPASSGGDQAGGDRPS